MTVYYITVLLTDGATITIDTCFPQEDDLATIDHGVHFCCSEREQGMWSSIVKGRGDYGTPEQSSSQVEIGCHFCTGETEALQLTNAALNISPV